MKTTKVKAISSFMHGRTHLHAGEEGELSKGDAAELQKLGMVELIDDDEPAQEENLDDVLGEPAQEESLDDVLGEKMDTGAVENKMDAEPKNKAGAKGKKG